MNEKEKEQEKNYTLEAMKLLNPRKVLIPVLLGLSALAYFVISSDELNWNDIVSHLKTASPFWLCMSLFALFARDFGYMYRIRHITSKQLSWTSSFYVILLWEFTSAITPSVVGGTTVAMFILNREGINFGKSFAYVWLTAVLDNLFFVFASTFVIIFVPTCFPNIHLEALGMDTAQPIKVIFIISSALIGIYAIGMGYGLFFGPVYVKRVLWWFTKFPLFKRWRKGAIQTGNDMMKASKELKGMSTGYWVRASASTLLVWLFRYLIVNFLIAAFSDTTFAEHLLIFGRHLIMWIAMLVAPTPGSSGIAEAFFPQFFGEFSNNFSVAIGLIWRLMTYYTYLAMGALFLPRWFSRALSRK
jgi:hypothetical protein